MKEIKEKYIKEKKEKSQARIHATNCNAHKSILSASNCQDDKLIIFHIIMSQGRP